MQKRLIDTDLSKQTSSSSKKLFSNVNRFTLLDTFFYTSNRRESSRLIVNLLLGIYHVFHTNTNLHFAGKCTIKSNNVRTITLMKHLKINELAFLHSKNNKAKSLVYFQFSHNLVFQQWFHFQMNQLKSRRTFVKSIKSTKQLRQLFQHISLEFVFFFVEPCSKCTFDGERQFQNHSHQLHQPPPAHTKKKY